ncbi:uncharacterized protein A4U43_C05F15140 [Asparagus officinalis]|uniref:Uncharacterized protein n=1 Tax=Asparagus officinalis TaxID=4686 RepID=A0A5P1ESD7_ASPOF|nr:uncharacterized protein A4U43_C05F15140 [Asparagus officinalis]
MRLVGVGLRSLVLGLVYGFDFVWRRQWILKFPIIQVHDFGFFHYDPKAIKFLKYEEIPLALEAACVGLEIRVVGNDSGEKAGYRME